MRVGPYNTPLKLRASYNRLIKCSNRWKIVRLLFTPYPWHLPRPGPLSVPELQSAGEELPFIRYPGIRRLYDTPWF